MKKRAFSVALALLGLTGCDPHWSGLCDLCPGLCQAGAIDDSEPEALPPVDEPAEDPVEQSQLIAVEIADDTPTGDLQTGRTALLNFAITALEQNLWFEEINFRVETINGPELQLQGGLWIVDRTGAAFLNDPLFAIVPPRVTSTFDDGAYPDLLAGTRRGFGFDAELTEDRDLSGETTTFRICVASVAVLEPANWALHVVEFDGLCGPELTFAY